MKAARQQAIVDLLLNHTSLTTEALSEQLKVSKETIRRDLNELQTQGKILRNHGRAKYIHRQNQDSGDPFHIRLKSHYAHKADIAREALEFFEIDALGLDTMDVRILTALCSTFRGRPVGLTTVASAVSEDPATLEDVYEPYLLQCGLIVRTPQGRQATLSAFDHLGVEPPAR